MTSTLQLKTLYLIGLRNEVGEEELEVEAGKEVSVARLVMRSLVLEVATDIQNKTRESPRIALVLEEEGRGVEVEVEVEVERANAQERTGVLQLAAKHECVEIFNAGTMVLERVLDS